MTSDLKLKPSDVLAKAADLIEPPGAWTSGYTRSGKQSYCIITALKQFFPVGMAWDSVIQPVQQVIGSPYVIGWNDARDRTQAEVVAALRAASTLAREAGE